MNIFLAVLTGIIMVVGVIISVPLSTVFMNRSASEPERFWRWRFLGIFTMLAGAGLAIGAFILIARLLS